jgi:hypothetical protein
MTDHIDKRLTLISKDFMLKFIKNICFWFLKHKLLALSQERYSEMIV